MSQADLADIGSLDIAASRGPQGWIDWNLRNYSEQGFGLWIIETRAGDFVGDCGLTVQQVDGKSFIETGWHVRTDLRGRGYAVEAAGAVRDAAAAAGMTHLIAIIRPDNVASQRVATKIGMRLQREADVHGGPALIFGIDLTATSASLA